jgi:hypothetical protein
MYCSFANPTHPTPSRFYFFAYSAALSMFFMFIVAYLLPCLIAPVLVLLKQILEYLSVGYLA